MQRGYFNYFIFIVFLVLILFFAFFLKINRQNLFHIAIRKKEVRKRKLKFYQQK